MHRLRLPGIFILMLIVSNAYSQHWVNKDTINIRGYIYNYVGKPVNKLLITSKQWDLEYNKYRISSVTDSSGYFELKGAKPNDTLTTEDHLLYDRITCLNRGSRFMMIYLPPPKHTTTALSAPAAVTILHKRTQAKKAVPFKTKPFNETLCFFHVVAYPEYAKGKQAFEESLNKNIQYPVEALQHNIEGVVRITFTVQKDGVTSNF